MKAFAMGVVNASLFMLACVGLAFGADDQAEDHLARNYFGHIEAPCADKRKCDEFEALVKSATLETQCPDIDKPCGVGEDILQRIFGPTHRDTLADFIVYLDDSIICNCNEKTIQFKKHSPLLMWKGGNTPHLFGVKYIYVMVLSHNKVNLGQPYVTSEFNNQTNPLIGIFTAFNAPEIKGAEGKPSDSHTGTFRWWPLSGNEKDTPMWLGMAPIVVPENSINRVTVLYEQPPTKTDSATDTTLTITAQKDGTNDSVKLTAEKKSKPDKDAASEYTGDFLGVTGHFTNSPASYAAASLAVGATATGGGYINGNVYVFAKFYPFGRPYLNDAPDSSKSLYSRVFGVVVGSNIPNGGGKIFDETVLGISYGPLFGNVGVIVGANHLASTVGTNNGRKTSPFLGLDYTL